MEENKIILRLKEIIAVQSLLSSINFDLDRFMNVVAEKIMQLSSATGAVVELVEANNMVYRAAVGTVAQFVGLRLNKKNSISGLCVQLGEVLCSDDTENDPRVNKEACRRVSARSMVVAPLFHEGKTVGVLKIVSAKPNKFGEDDVQTLQLMAGLIGSALAHQMAYDNVEKLLQEKISLLEKLKKYEDKLKHLATYDYLTDLPNRYLFTHTLKTAIAYAKRYHTKIAVFFLDIDHFKNVNDTLGHESGDILLKTFATRLKNCIRESDTVARIGGDEFIILQNHIENEDNAKTLALKIIHAMEALFVLNDQQLKITTSIGISILNDKNISSDELIAQADQALYQSKQAGRNTFTIYPN